MAHVPASVPSNIGDTKHNTPVNIAAGPSNDDPPPLQRNTAGQWVVPAGPGDKAGPDPDRPPDPVAT
ncbi:MAG TPA: hypothetical protein VFF73_07085 [Planctomycetota bacterium]|nr:hypothetical protein [Planctomycetota bacterium]